VSGIGWAYEGRRIRGLEKTAYNEELHYQYSSPIDIWVIKSRRMSWARHVARVGRVGVYKMFWWEKLSEKYHL
jgi:hypothetical protein